MQEEAITVDKAHRVVVADRITEVIPAALHLNQATVVVITAVQRLPVVTVVEIAVVVIGAGTVEVGVVVIAVEIAVAVVIMEVPVEVEVVIMEVPVEVEAAGI